MKHSETIGKIAPALVQALNEIGGVMKGTTNTFFKSKYATLEAVIDSSKPILASHGIALMQFPGAFVAGSMSLETVLFHESGEWISGDEAFGVATGKQDPQAIGSALSYARRYAQMAVLNMPALDDDGEAAMTRNPPKRTEPKNPSISVHPEGPDWYGAEGPGMVANQATKEGLGEMLDKWLGEIPSIPTTDALGKWARDYDEEIKRLPKSWRVMVREAVEERKAEL